MFDWFGLDVPELRFGQPVWLPLFAAPALLVVLWLWRLVQRSRDRGAVLRRSTGRTAMLSRSAGRAAGLSRSAGRAAGLSRSAGRAGFSRPHISLFGDLPAWLLLVLALAATVLALARPLVVTSSVRTAGIDLVILQDGSASMRVRDVRGDRWQRSTRFLRALGESLRWEDDRIALALFASLATPQIRLTRDPNTFFFFLDNLEDESPFRVQDIGTWDTNIERGIYWGLRLVDKDRELRGPTRNARAFVLVSDGQAWSGEVEQSLALARKQKIPIHVVGVGTTAGGVIPEPQRAANDEPVSSRLDRNSLAVIATAGGGRYFELDREPDRDIANAIIATTRRQAAHSGVAEGTEDLYPQCLLAAAGLLLLAVFTRLL